MKKLLTACAALALVLALPGVASAKRGDRNHDRIPDRWERAHHLSLRVNQARRDQDHDGLRNLAEFRAGDNPRDSDTDGDGVPDGREHAGRVSSFDNGVLTIQLFGGSTLSGMVTPDTELKCHGATATAAHEDGSDGQDGAGSGDQGPGGDRGDGQGDRGDDQGDSGDDQGDRENDGADEHACPDGALAPGAVVHEAEMRVTGAGAVFTQIELADVTPSA
jgi:hypothetical protein